MSDDKEILLPRGRTCVTVDEIPRLIAQALYPPNTSCDEKKEIIDAQWD
jgi:hypothetical protein